ncbi:hypothetical protein DPMN_074906 [Dreissena polymorpha]|uniref:Uncharacterized protein n=1 Tax=Dreissena polymorpha TaxID=45954 RepID=A0A9D4BEF9_DREPO|nr:hypothetical protein DPMN_074906 [Dreissena polymorpha]
MILLSQLSYPSCHDLERTKNFFSFAILTSIHHLQVPLGQQTYSTPRKASAPHRTSMPVLSRSMSRDLQASVAVFFHTAGRSHTAESCLWSNTQCWGTRRASLSKSSTASEKLPHILVCALKEYRIYEPRHANMSLNLGILSVIHVL